VALANCYPQSLFAKGIWTGFPMWTGAPGYTCQVRLAGAWKPVSNFAQKVKANKQNRQFYCDTPGELQVTGMKFMPRAPTFYEVMAMTKAERKQMQEQQAKEALDEQRDLTG